MNESIPPQPQETPEQRDIRENKDIAAVSYVWILAPIVYFSRKDSPFIQFHAKQGMILFVMSIPLWFIPYIGHYLEFLILAGMVMGFLNAFQGQRADVPLIGKMARGEMTSLQALQHILDLCVRTFRTIIGKKSRPSSDMTPPPTPSAPSDQLAEADSSLPSSTPYDSKEV